MSDLIERLRARVTHEKTIPSMGHNAADRERAELIALLREAAAALEAAQEDACVALVADIRFACGDNGKRMQPELVEFIRGLARDAQRYRWLRDGGLYRVGFDSVGSTSLGDLDTAIDAARREG